MVEKPWEGPQWLYGLQLLACGLVIYSRVWVKGKSPFLKRTSTMARFTPNFICFQRLFLSVFFLASLADGLQLVHWEALYQHHGLRRQDMVMLLAIGHGSSLSLGTFLGASADYIGRKRACMLYCSLQVVGCLAKQSSNLKGLCLAHMCLGLARSLYFSVFEAWMTAEHEKMGFRQELLSDTFWLMSFAAGIVGISSGALANFLVEWEGLSGAAPSTAAAVVAALCLLMISSGWAENVGSHRSSLSSALINAFDALCEKRVALLGWTQACFDLSIAIFWILWTPTLVADGREVHSGFIFARLMASMMLGSSIAALFLCGPFYVLPEIYLPYVFGVAGASLILPAYDYQEIGLLVACFCVFHICIGIAWPSMARLRSMIQNPRTSSLRMTAKSITSGACKRYISNDRRAAVLSLLQVPVLAFLLFIFIRGLDHKLENSTIFSVAILGLLSGALCIHWIAQMRQASSYENYVWKSHDKQHTNV